MEIIQIIYDLEQLQRKLYKISYLVVNPFHRTENKRCKSFNCFCFLLGKETDPKVLAFEPMASSVESLLHSIAKNHLQNQILLFPYALMENSSNCAHSKLTAGRYNFGATKIVKEENCANGGDVKVRTLDAILPTLQILSINQGAILLKMTSR